VNRKLQYERHFVALLGRMPFEVARELVLRYAQVVLRAQKAGRVSIGHGERTVFNTDVMFFFEEKDPAVARLISDGTQGGDVRELSPAANAFESFCEDLDKRIDALLGLDERQRGGEG